ncbi:MAG: ABC transporter permease subunit [Anaerolineales bacterium]|nr:ABC transporter permease subunit [Anaerolineales bacterium]
MARNRSSSFKISGLGMARGAIVIAVLLPIVPLLIWSAAFRWYFPHVLPTAWSGRAWAYVLSPSSQVLPALGYSTLVATAVTLLSILISIPAGRALGLYQFRGKTAVQFLILAPTIVPTIAVAMGIHVAFIRYGLADTLPGVILVHLIPVTPYMTLILASVFATFNPDYEAQARTLGAAPWQAFWHVTLPAIWPGLLVGSLFAFIISWSQYLLTLLIGGGRVITLPLLLFSFANSGDYPITAALSIIFIAPAILFLVLTARHLTGESAALGGFGKL